MAWCVILWVIDITKERKMDIKVSEMRVNEIRTLYQKLMSDRYRLGADLFRGEISKEVFNDKVKPIDADVLVCEQELKKRGEL